MACCLNPKFAIENYIDLKYNEEYQGFSKKLKGENIHDKNSRFIFVIVKEMTIFLSLNSKRMQCTPSAKNVFKNICSRIWRKKCIIFSIADWTKCTFQCQTKTQVVEHKNTTTQSWKIYEHKPWSRCEHKNDRFATECLRFQTAWNVFRPQAKSYSR